MRFHLWRKSDSDPDHQVSHPRPDPDESVNLDSWVELGGPEDFAEILESSPLDIDLSDSVDVVDDRLPGSDLGSLREKLLAVLADDEASLVPPSAGDMTQLEWNELTESERETYRRDQLKRIDPRLVPHVTLNTPRSSKTARTH